MILILDGFDTLQYPNVIKPGIYLYGAKPKYNNTILISSKFV